MNSFVIEREKIKNNAEVILSKAQGATVFAVVKGRGYGFDINEYAPLLYDCGIRNFAVTDVSDALLIRKLFSENCEILMLRSTAVTEELSSLIENNVILTVGSCEAAVNANAIAAQACVTSRIHIKIDTGMGRYGFTKDDTDIIASLFTDFDSLSVCGMFTHLSCAFKSKKFTNKQIEILFSVRNELQKRNLDCGMIHFANSAYLFNFTSPIGDAVRIGSAFTGRIAGSIAGSGLKRVGYLKGNICDIRTLAPGSSIGYGAAYVTKRETKTAVIPIGYSDGFHVEKARDSYRLCDGIVYALMELKRALTKKSAYVRINGKNARVLGHIGMTHTVCDITNIPCSVGDVAEFDINPIYIPPDIQREYI